MKLDYISARGERLPLVNNKWFTLINADGMTSASSNISSVVIGGIDGDIVNNIQAQPRGIVLDLRIKDDVNVENAKREITRVVKLKQKGTLEWIINNKKLTITGIVESIDMPRWSAGVVLQVSLYCEQPFWEDADALLQHINDALNLHYFTANDEMLFFQQEGRALGEYDVSRTQEIHNAGDVGVGLDIEILAHKRATNPIIHDHNGNFFGVGYGTGAKKVVMNAGDIINISTHRGNKKVTMNGTSILGRVMPHSTWLQLEAGNNTFSINTNETDLTNVTFSLSYKRRYV